MKPWYLSKISNLNFAAGSLFLADAAERFISTGGLDNLCARKSAIAAGVMFFTSLLRVKYTKVDVGRKDG
jgi:hypothetical protein